MTDKEGDTIMTIIEDVPVYDEDGNVISEYDLGVGYLVDCWDASDGEMRLVKYVYHRHTDETRAAERRATIDAGAADFFADGGRERMKAEIDTAKATAEEAKQTVSEAGTTADTAAASMNEYLDALLGLDATDETEATDAE